MRVKLASDLWNARRLGQTISAERDDLPGTLEEAYDIQAKIAQLSGMAQCGYKVGSTSREAQRLLSTNEPSAGILLAPYVYASPAEVTIAAEQGPSIEGEFAFRMGRDIGPSNASSGGGEASAGAYTIDDVAGAISDVAGAIEIVGTRFSGGLAGKGRLLTTADGGVNIGLVRGDWVPFAQQDLAEHSVSMKINGEQRDIGTGSRALGDPLNVLVWLVSHLSARGVGLRKHDIVTTGTCTGLDRVQPGDVASADFGSLGRVDVAFQ